MTTLPAELKLHFWDVEFSDLDVSEDAFLIIKRVLDRGNTSAIRWLKSTYSLGKISEVIQTTRDLSFQTGNFWADFLKLDKNKLPCLSKPYSPTQFGLSS